MLAGETLIGPGKQDVLIPESLRKLPLPEHLRNTHSKEQDIPVAPGVFATAVEFSFLSITSQN